MTPINLEQVPFVHEIPAPDYSSDGWLAEIHAILDEREFCVLTPNCVHGWSMWAHYAADMI